MVQQIVPNIVSCQHFRIPANDHPILRPGQSHIQPSRVIQKTDPLPFIRSHTSDDNKVFFPSLKPVHTDHFDVFVDRTHILPILLEIIHKVAFLSFIGGDDPDLGGFHIATEEFVDDPLHLDRFYSI